MRTVVAGLAGIAAMGLSLSLQAGNHSCAGKVTIGESAGFFMLYPWAARAQYGHTASETH
jgi:hypothetical protein